MRCAAISLKVPGFQWEALADCKGFSVSSLHSCACVFSFPLHLWNNNQVDGKLSRAAFPKWDHIYHEQSASYQGTSRSPDWKRSMELPRQASGTVFRSEPCHCAYCRINQSKPNALMGGGDGEKDEMNWGENDSQDDSF